MNIPICPAIGALNVTLVGWNEPIVPGLLCPFSDLCDFKVIPNLLTGPCNPFPLVSPLTSARFPFSKMLETEISFPKFSFKNSILSS